MSDQVTNTRPYLAVALTALEWSELLGELKWLMNMAGHERFAQNYFKKIADQLSDKPISFK